MEISPLEELEMILEKDPHCRACGEVKQADIDGSDLISTEEVLSKGAEN